MDLKIKQNKTVREKNYIRIINRYIQSYIKNPIGSLNLENAPINVLPDNLKYVDFYLDIENSKIIKLPNGLVIDDTLFIQNTSITELPDDIVINGHLFCYDSPLGDYYTAEELKDKYKIKGNIYGTKY